MVLKFKDITAVLQIPHQLITIRTKEIQTHTQENTEHGKMKTHHHRPMVAITITETADITGMATTDTTGELIWQIVLGILAMEKPLISLYTIEMKTGIK